MKYLYKVTIFFSLLIFFSCEVEKEFEKAKYVGLDKISKVEISPNSPQLIANGKAQLNFKVKCYYFINDTVEVPMIMDRIPLNEIKITSSDNKVLGIYDGYSSTSNADSVYFFCSVGSIKSEKVAVALTHPKSPTFEETVVPIIFHGIYTEETQNQIRSFTPKLLQEIIDRVNKIFAAELVNAPSSCPSGIRFEIAEINKVKISPIENKNIVTYIENNLMTKPSNYLNIWVMNVVPWQLGSDVCRPSFTFGNPDNIKGLKLKKIAKIDEAGKAKPQNVGFALSFDDIYKTLSGNASERFEMKLGFFYGLLATSHSNEETNLLINGDLDYCPDTYSYINRYTKLEKKTFPVKKERAYFYDSFNIMDEVSTSNTISRDQVVRIRKVIQDCAFRQIKK